MIVHLAWVLVVTALHARGRRRVVRTARAQHEVRGPLAIDPVARAVCLAGTSVELSKMELELLSALAAEPERVFTKSELLRDVWGFRSPARTRTVDSHACRLRNKLAAVGGRGYIENVWGVGYRLLAAEGRRDPVDAA